ncbi:glycine cleavage system protein h : Glycine cleavage system H protein OS=Planctomyces maris DSM 8797 GN=gcvH PE=3 SV=1: GCV_H [Gemmataceae bacterium]|nr:glycine cleavage system protein h : Glycine cleavage system H protein OS=Planctomyces maris DSM 8797 GN=gcvH PE=3 SV=1: GCV_H [Gemmataceae bacterium]VTT98513.1 glycine cleavage system protein h : Glycine cleavage system H protein OS=Planctomyces maris DSM 8797 GN=gcvH PE=3 SV=1: GCV_H [Gemmataceae bacterium]
MSNPADLRYSPTHEWAKLDGDVVTIGVTKFAVEQLTEPTFLELPAVGKALAAGAAFGIIESVKSTSDLNSPVTGTVVERNERLLDDKAKKRAADLAPVNDDPFGAGWMLKVKLAPGATLDHLLTAAQYDEQLASDGH